MTNLQIINDYIDRLKDSQNQSDGSQLLLLHANNTVIGGDGNKSCTNYGTTNCSDSNEDCSNYGTVCKNSSNSGKCEFHPGGGEEIYDTCNG